MVVWQLAVRVSPPVTSGTGHTRTGTAPTKHSLDFSSFAFVLPFLLAHILLFLSRSLSSLSYDFTSSTVLSTMHSLNVVPPRHLPRLLAHSRKRTTPRRRTDNRTFSAQSWIGRGQ
ncbi:hypothetical protein C8R44DRAFT_892500 [Mycena epipterygia]|nr:hypothetical protein C8R44DRAFT_892500 [Mycena epipterygia]